MKQTDEPWVVFSNAEFVGRPETGMRYFNASRRGAPIGTELVAVRTR